MQDKILKDDFFLKTRFFLFTKLMSYKKYYSREDGDGSDKMIQISIDQGTFKALKITDQDHFKNLLANSVSRLLDEENLRQSLTPALVDSQIDTDTTLLLQGIIPPYSAIIWKLIEKRHGANRKVGHIKISGCLSRMVLNNSLETLLSVRFFGIRSLVIATQWLKKSI